MAITTTPSPRTAPYHAKKLTAKQLAEWGGRLRFANKNPWQALVQKHVLKNEGTPTGGLPRVVVVPRLISTKPQPASGVYFGNQQLATAEALHPLLNKANKIPSSSFSPPNTPSHATAAPQMTSRSVSPLPCGKPMAPAPMLGRWKAAGTCAPQNKTKKNEKPGCGIHFRAPVQVTQLDDYDKEKGARRRAALELKNQKSPAAALVSLSPEERLFVEAATTLRNKTTSPVPPTTNATKNTDKTAKKALPPPPFCIASLAA